MTNIDDELDSLNVEFLHGVPVKLPTEAKAAIKQLIEAHTDKAVEEARVDELNNLPSNVAELREYLPRRNAELRGTK